MESSLDLDAALLKAQVKARLLGWPEEPVQLGRFAIERCLGRGVVGAVYAARDGASGARVALKQLHAGAWAAAALRREFRSLSRIVHPNLVALHELFGVQDQWFLTIGAAHNLAFVHARNAVALYFRTREPRLRREL